MTKHKCTATDHFKRAQLHEGSDEDATNGMPSLMSVCVRQEEDWADTAQPYSQSCLHNRSGGMGVEEARSGFFLTSTGVGWMDWSPLPKMGWPQSTHHTLQRQLDNLCSLSPLPF